MWISISAIFLYSIIILLEIALIIAFFQINANKKKIKGLEAYIEYIAKHVYM